MRITHLLVFLAGTMTVAGVSTSTAAAITFTPIGTPTWEPVDAHLFSAPIGTESSGYSEYADTLSALLPEPNHKPHQDLGIGPGDPHAPPYDSELADGVTNLGAAQKTVFDVSEFSNGNAVFVTWMNVPLAGSAVGSSPDFASDLIIPNSLFPIRFSAKTLRDGVLFSEETFFDVPALNDELHPPFDVEGHSHFPAFFVENFDFALNPSAGVNGAYEMILDLRRVVDGQEIETGWHVVVPFQVVPEPGTVGLLIAGLIGLWLIGLNTKFEGLEN